MLADGVSGVRNRNQDLDLGLWRDDGGIPVKQAIATVTGEKLAFAKLVPDLWANAHTATAALLTVGLG
jgi:hypothetical protein